MVINFLNLVLAISNEISALFLNSNQNVRTYFGLLENLHFCFLRKGRSWTLGLRSIFKFAVEIVTFPQGQQCKAAEDERELESSYTTRGINNKVTNLV